MARARALRTVEAAQPLETLRQTALETQDGILLADIIRRIGENDSPSDQRAELLDLIAKTNPEKTNVVIGCISALHRLESPLLLSLCRTLINAPFNPDRDFIVAFAVETLASLPSPEKVDMLLLAKAVDHRSMKIQSTARRVVSQLPRQQLRAFLELIDDNTDRPSVLLLRRLLSNADLTALVLPPRPTDPETQQAPKERTDAQRGGTRKKATPRSTSKEISTTTAPPEPEPLAEPQDPFRMLNSHRLPELLTASNSTLQTLIETSSNYRELAAAMAEYTVRHGCYTARQFNSKLLYALGDPRNSEKARFSDLALLWHRTD